MNERLAKVVSNAKVTRCRANVRIRESMISPAATAARSGANADRPWAMTSVLTNSLTPREFFNRCGAAVVLPAPFGPASTMTFGEPAAANQTALVPPQASIRDLQAFASCSRSHAMVFFTPSSYDTVDCQPSSRRAFSALKKQRRPMSHTA